MMENDDMSEIQDLGRVFENTASMGIEVIFKRQGQLPSNFLSREEERELVLEWQRNPKNKNILNTLLISSGLQTIHRQAKRRKGYGLPHEEFLQEGVTGFIKGLKKYDPDHEREARLSTYTKSWIVAEMNEYAINNFTSIKTGTTKERRKLFFGLRSTAAKLEVDLGNLSDGDVEKLASAIGVSIENTREMAHYFSTGRGYVSLDDFKEIAKKGSIVDIMEDVEEQESRKSIFLAALNDLTDRERHILLSRNPNDMDTTAKKTLHELAQIYGVSNERIRQIEKAAIKQVKQYITQSNSKINPAAARQQETLLQIEHVISEI